MRNKIIVAILAVIIFSTLKSKFERFNIPQNGMYPSRPAGSTHWVTKNTYKSIADVVVGDVVLFHQDIDGQRYTYVWRVIALPGDEVSIVNDQVTINDELLTHEHVRTDGVMEIYLEHNGGKSYEVAYDSQATEQNRQGANLTVPDGHLFMLGDNRYNAMDSRYHGAVPFKAVFGKM